MIGIAPVVGTVVTAVVGGWMLATAFIAIRQALDIGNGRTLLAVLVGGGVYNILEMVLPF